VTDVRIEAGDLVTCKRVAWWAPEGEKVGVLDKDNKLVAQGSRFLGGAISWKWIRKDYQDD